MARNWNPICRLSLSGSGGATGDLVAQGGGMKDLQVEFEIESHTLQSPDTASFVVYNVDPAVAAKVRAEFTEIVFMGGFEKNNGELFRGQIVEIKYRKCIDNLTSTILRISAANSDLAYNNAQVNTTLPAGSTHKDIVDKCADALKAYGVSMGQIVGVDLGQIKFPRAITLSGMVRDVLRRTCLANGANFTFSGSQLNILHRTASGLGSSGIVISGSTGMVGQPILRETGVVVSTLINPAIKLNTTVKIASDIITPSISPAKLLPDTETKKQPLERQLSPSSNYQVLHMVTRGDSRGEDWMQTLTTIGVGLSTEQLAGGLEIRCRHVVCRAGLQLRSGHARPPHRRPAPHRPRGLA